MKMCWHKHILHIIHDIYMCLCIIEIFVSQRAMEKSYNGQYQQGTHHLNVWWLQHKPNSTNSGVQIAHVRVWIWGHTSKPPPTNWTNHASKLPRHKTAVCSTCCISWVRWYTFHFLEIWADIHTRWIWAELGRIWAFFKAKCVFKNLPKRDLISSLTCLLKLVDSRPILTQTFTLHTEKEKFLIFWGAKCWTQADGLNNQ